MDEPIIETERLVLRPPIAEDFETCRAMWADPNVMRYISGPNSEEDAWARFLRMNGHWALMGYGFWSVVERESGRRIGEVGLLNVKRAIAPPLEGMPECGWSFARTAQGKGFAGEAVKAMIGWGERRFGRVRMCCIIHPDNAPSLRLAERNGFVRGPLTTYKDEPIVILTRDPA